MFVIPSSAIAYQNISVGLGGGYSGNLFSDSFAVGNSYLLNNISLSTVHFSDIRLKVYYDLSYYQYDTGDFINNLFHVPGIALYRRDPAQNLKWGVEIAAALKDYIDKEANYDNWRLLATGDISYYILPGLQIKGKYRAIKSGYDDYEILDNLEHLGEAEVAATFPSKTTVRGSMRYGRRAFDEEDLAPSRPGMIPVTHDNKYDWVEAELGASQSLGMKTGVSLLFTNRWSSSGARPLFSYYIISGITSYWDPWDGFQSELALKRILPFAVVSKLKAGYWDRKFTYDDKLTLRLPWLRGKTGRRDRGWSAGLELNRQFGRKLFISRSLSVSIGAGYTSNDSDDPFYDYEYLSATSNLTIRIF